MGVNLVTRVRNFSIHDENFGSSDHDVQDGCVTPGPHRVMRFDFLSYNAGDADLVIGSPAARPDLFVWSAGHGHYHLKDFNEFLVFDAAGSLSTIGYKQAFCAIDIERISTTASPSGRFHDCNVDQGISAGWADVYRKSLPCQYIVIDGLADGDYTLQSTTNTQHKIAEDCYGDNTIWTGLRIKGKTVQDIDPPFIPEDRIPFNRAQIAAVRVGGRWKVTEGSHWMLDTGTNAGQAHQCVDVINHYKLSSMCFVGRPTCGDVTPMMYWLDDTGKAPTGHMPDEDVIGFDRSKLQVVQIGDRWKVVEGTHWLLDFGAGQGNAIAALHFIRKHKFDEICYVGRPHAPMTYFKRHSRRPHAHTFIDPRDIAAPIDPPAWWKRQQLAVAERSPWVDFGSECVGVLASNDGSRGVRIQAEGERLVEVVERLGLTGVDAGHEIEICLTKPADVVDIGIVHFGHLPNLKAWSGKKCVAEGTTDAGQRQVENVRLVGAGIDRVLITAAEHGALINYVRSIVAADRPRPNR